MTKLTIWCACCVRPEPPEGWHACAVVDGEIDEAYCSQECMIAHEGGLCACFCESESYEMMGNEEV